MEWIHCTDGTITMIEPDDPPPDKPKSLPATDYDAWRRERFNREILRAWFPEQFRGRLRDQSRDRPEDDLIGLIGNSPGGPSRDGRRPVVSIDRTRHPFRVGIPPG